MPPYLLLLPHYIQTAEKSASIEIKSNKSNKNLFRSALDLTIESKLLILDNMEENMQIPAMLKENIKMKPTKQRMQRMGTEKDK